MLSIDEETSIAEKTLTKDTKQDYCRVMESTRLLDLPKELLVLVMQHLSLAEHVRLSTVCKTLQRDIIPLSWSPQTPFLLFTEKKKSVCKFFDPSYKRMYVTCIPELLDATLHYSKDGWLLLSQNDKSHLFFLNPFTKEKVDLPKFNESFPVFSVGHFFVISFSSPPTSQDCIVFAIQVFEGPDVFYTCRPGDMSWTTIFADEQRFFLAAYNNPVYFDGAFYCLGTDGDLGVFNVTDNSWKVHENPTCVNFREHNCSLVEFQGELLLVFCGHRRNPSHVFQLDRSEMAWIKMKSLNDKMLFVDQLTSLSATAVVRGMENKIYFPKFRRDCSYDLVFYSLDTKTHNIKFNNCKEHVKRIWVDPTGFELLFGTKSREENPLIVLGKTK